MSYESITTSDDVVDALAKMLCGDSEPDSSQKSFDAINVRKSRAVKQLMSADHMYTFGKMSPGRAFTFDPLDDDRLFSADADCLVKPPDEVIGTSAEVLMVDSGTVKWLGLRKARALPKGLCTLVRCRTLYEVHFRRLTGEGCVEYNRAMVGVSVGGRPTPVLIPRANASGSSEVEMLVMAASVIEDAYRANTVLAEFSDGARLLMPVSVDDYLDLFKLRDAPLTPSGRRRAILHWVASHKRRKVNKPAVQVREHLRGVEEFTTDGLTVRLTPNARY